MWPALHDPASDLEPGSPPPRRLAPWAVAALSAGYSIARAAPELPPTPLLIAAAAALLLALFIRGFACRVTLFTAIAIGGAAWFGLSVLHRPADSLWWRLHHAALAEPSLVRVRGLLLTAPEPQDHTPRPWPATPRPRSVALLLDLRDCGPADAPSPASGRVRLRIEAPIEQLPAFIRAGATIRATGRLLPTQSPANPGDPPRDLLAAQSDHIGTLVVTSTELLEASSPESLMDRLRSQLLAARAALHAAIAAPLTPADNTGPSASSALLRAMLLGERDPALEPVESAFRRVGLVHLVAISGFNLAALVWITLLLVRLTGDWSRLEAVIGALAVTAYLFILPSEASIQRAGFTLLIFTVAQALGRRYDRVNLLAWCAFFLLLIRPLDLWSLGFQLSFGIVAALLTLGTRVHQRLWGLTIRGLTPTPRQRSGWYVIGAGALELIKAQISATLLAWAVAAPLIAHHTGLFSPLAPIASLIMLPITVLLLGVGYAVMLLGLIIPSATEFITLVLDWLGRATIALVHHIDEWPGAAIHLPRLSHAWTLAATVVAVYTLAWARLRTLWPWIAACIVIAWTALTLTTAARGPAHPAMRLDAFAMGDGDAALVRTGQPQEALLIDCGTSSERPTADALVRSIRELGGWHVPTVLITSPDVRNWSLLPGLIEPLGIRTVLLPESLINAADLEPSGTHARLLAVLRQHHLTIRILAPGDQFALGAATCRLLSTGDHTPRTLLPQLTVPTTGGQRRVLLGSSTTYAQLTDAASPADALVLPRAVRQSDKPADLLTRIDPSIILHTGPRSDARLLIERLGAQHSRLHLTSLSAASIVIAADGRIYSADKAPNHP